MTQNSNLAGDPRIAYPPAALQESLRRELFLRRPFLRKLSLRKLAVRDGSPIRDDTANSSWRIPFLVRFDPTYHRSNWMIYVAYITFSHARQQLREATEPLESIRMQRLITSEHNTFSRRTSRSARLPTSSGTITGIRLCAALLCASFLSGCPPLLYMPEPKRPPVASNAPRGNAVYTHTVRHTGETIGIIALWYTGSRDNWRALLADNPGLGERRIRVGDKIKIRSDLLVRSTPVPPSFILEETKKRIKESGETGVPASRRARTGTHPIPEVSSDDTADLPSLPSDTKEQSDEENDLRDHLLESYLE